MDDNKSLKAVREVEHAAKVSVESGRKTWIQEQRTEREMGLEQSKSAREKQDTEILRWDDHEGLGAELTDAEQHIKLLQDINRDLTDKAFPQITGPEVEHKTTHCLRRAAALVCGERAADYGPPSASFTAVAQAWQAYFDACPNEDVNARDVANMMIIYKCIRDAHKPKSDNMDDIAGYAQVAAWIGTDA